MNGWHIVDSTLFDGQPVPPDGIWLPRIDNIELCKRGYHGARRIIDALTYARGATVCWCEFGGKIIDADDIFVAQSRRIIWRIDGAAVLRAWARWCAMQVVGNWNAPNLVVRFLETGDESLASAALDVGYDAVAAPYTAEVVAAAAHAAARSAAAAHFMPVVSYINASNTAHYVATAMAYAASDAYDSDVYAAAEAAAQNEHEKKLLEMIAEARFGRREWKF